MIVIVDYGVGNIFSLYRSFKYIGADVLLTSDPKEIKKADKIILPGVGAFGDAVKKLRESGLAEVIIEEAGKGKPLLGICLGMQMLFERSLEYGEHKGLGLIQGDVVPMERVLPEGYKVPHIGWNSLHFPEGKPKNEIFQYMKEGECVYFVHSFCGTNCGDSLIAVTEYGTEITAAVSNKSVYGVQFHPEKSGETGLNILKAFCEME